MDEFALHKRIFYDGAVTKNPTERRGTKNVKRILTLAVTVAVLAVMAMMAQDFTPKPLKDGATFSVVPLPDGGTIREVLQMMETKADQKWSANPNKANERAMRFCGDYFGIVGEPGYPAAKFGGLLFFYHGDQQTNAMLADMNKMKVVIEKNLKVPKTTIHHTIQGDNRSPFANEIHISQSDFDQAKGCLVLTATARN